jgi:hypothetical protein
VDSPWVDCETGERPPWFKIGVTEAVLLVVGVLLVIVSVGLGEPWRLLALVIGCVVVGFTLLSCMTLGFMAMISAAVRYPKATALWVLAFVAVGLLVGSGVGYVFDHF